MDKKLHWPQTFVAATYAVVMLNDAVAGAMHNNLVT